MGGLALEKARREYEQHYQKYKLDISELSQGLDAIKSEKERIEADRDRLAVENEELRRQVEERPKASTPSLLPVEELKKALEHHRNRSTPDAPRGKILYELADSIEEVLAGKPFTPKKNKGGRKPKK